MPRIEVVYALAHSVDAVSLDLPRGATVSDAVAASGMTQRHPEIALRPQALGIHGRRVGADATLADGDRLEIYRPLAIDPKEARRRRAIRKR